MAPLLVLTLSIVASVLAIDVSVLLKGVLPRTPRQCAVPPEIRFA
jgi:hypothetical protein